MTIADHCLALLSERSPLTLQELAAACVAAGVTKARDPLPSVRSALAGRSDEAPLLLDGRYGFALHVLDGCWFTTRQRSGDRLIPSFDIWLLQRLLARRPVPLASGGTVTSSEFADGLAGPPGWLPRHQDDALLGLRLNRGALEVRPVDLDSRSSVRGQDLAARLRARTSPRRGWWPTPGTGQEHEVWRALVQLVGQERDVLAAPVAPLSELLPDLAPRPEAEVDLGDPVVVTLPAALRRQLQQRAELEGVSLPRWLTDRLEELAHGGLFGRRNSDWYGDWGYRALGGEDEWTESAWMRDGA